MPDKTRSVHVWEEEVVIPTYEVGEPNKHPMFLEKRVYQGSSGKVYPYPVIEKVCDQKIDKTYKAVWLENDYIKVMILPEIGGRIQRAYDKTNGYDFVYYNEVIKPALVGLLGPWVSGGIEFNWPQHHRPTTFAPVDYTTKETPGGSKTVLVSEVDQMYGTKGMAAFTLYPDKAYIEIKGQLYNRTNMPQTFLWWANPAVAVNDNTQSIFPPDVHAVMDHGKRAVSKFPMATGEYYKYNYGSGVDISRYKNIPVPTSYMAYHSDYDFVGGYDYGVQAGVLHVADHHISPGKKQWTWGSGAFGKAWDRSLTDENGPYIELMTGVFTDNQPDFTWLQPFEEKVFTQYFMPYKQAGNVKNASKELVLNLEVDENMASICVYASAEHPQLRVRLSSQNKTYLDETAAISPLEVFSRRVPVEEAETELKLTVLDREGQELLTYQPQPAQLLQTPPPAEKAQDPQDIESCEKLYLTAQHLEQYRHATYEPDPYYLEGLRRDPEDIRINTAWGMLLLRRGQFAKAEEHFQTAIKRLTWRTPNPYDSEAFYGMGLALRYQGQDAKAYDAFYKATWTNAQQEMAFYHMASLCCKRGEPGLALQHVTRALIKNTSNLKARALQTLLLWKSGRHDGAKACAEDTLQLDPFAYTTRFLLVCLGEDKAEFMRLAQNRSSSFIEIAIDLAEAGEYTLACEALALCTAQDPMLHYFAAYYQHKMGQKADAEKELEFGASLKGDYCFPNRLEDIAVLEYAACTNTKDSKAPYYLGNLWYDKKQYQEACRMWEQSAVLGPCFPTVWRNLAIYYFNKASQPGTALAYLEKAFSLDPLDAGILLELDQLHKRLAQNPGERLEKLERHLALCQQRDDLYTEYVNLLNTTGQHEKAYERVMARQFHPLEGSEGKVIRQYTVALKQQALQALRAGEADKAIGLLTQSLVAPQNLGEDRLIGAKDNDIHYHLAQAYQAKGDAQTAKREYRLACEGTGSLGDMMYYYDQPADMILYQGLAFQALGQEEAARTRFHRLIDYGEQYIFGEVKLDFFAVSLPDLLLFETDRQQKNREHCLYLMALGHYGLNHAEKARQYCADVLLLDPAHLDAQLLKMQMGA